jgi:hypothetical protein
VYLKSTKEESSPPVAVKRGFSWPGFLFTWVWAFASGPLASRRDVSDSEHRCGDFFFINCMSARFSLPVLSLAFQLFFGLNGNSWRVRKLEALRPFSRGSRRSWVDVESGLPLPVVHRGDRAVARGGGGIAVADQGRRHGARVHADFADLHVEHHHGVAGAFHVVAGVRNAGAGHRGMSDADGGDQADCALADLAGQMAGA